MVRLFCMDPIVNGSNPPFAQRKESRNLSAFPGITRCGRIERKGLASLDKQRASQCQ